MDNNTKWRWRELILLPAAAVFIMVVQKAIPFFAMPNLQQAVWTSGFALSMSHGPLFHFFAHDFGLPQPAPIVFGLAGAWLESLWIRLGLYPADAYSLMVLFWLGLGFAGAYNIGRNVGATRTTAILAALTWISMPIIFAHAPYSMLSLGIGLLPLYFFAVQNLLKVAAIKGRKSFGLPAMVYFAVTTIAAFMDGYTFVMFAVGASMLIGYAFLIKASKRSLLVWRVFPVHALGFALAYGLYRSYVGHGVWEPVNIDFFREWGLDLSFVAIPTHDKHWLLDALGLSIRRSMEQYYGDDSVWTSTFCLPILLVGLMGWWFCRSKAKMATGMLFVGLFGLYMSLGPSLKINSTRPLAQHTAETSLSKELMHSEEAIMPTGSAALSKRLPGFKVMRASYRWVALAIFAFWSLALLGVARGKMDPRLGGALFLALAILNVPDLRQTLTKGVMFRELFKGIDRNVVPAMRQAIQPNETVAFIPWQNDFLVNYLAPRGEFRTYNIGGDKNTSTARKLWPLLLAESLGDDQNPIKTLPVLSLLYHHRVDVVVIPYFETFQFANSWPFNAGYPYAMPRPPDEPKIAALVRELQKNPYLDVTHTDLMATVRLRPGTDIQIHYPVVFGAQAAALENETNMLILGEGWHAVDHSSFVWSSNKARLRMVIPPDCQLAPCSAKITFTVFTASAKHPMAVFFDSSYGISSSNSKVVAAGEESCTALFPLNRALKIQDIDISIPDAVSPDQLDLSDDGRVLGMALQRVDLSRG